MGLHGWTGRYDLYQAMFEMHEAGAYLYSLRETMPNTPIRTRDRIRYVAKVRRRTKSKVKTYFGTDSRYPGNALREAVEKFILDHPDLTGPGPKRKRQQET